MIGSKSEVTKDYVIQSCIKSRKSKVPNKYIQQQDILFFAEVLALNGLYELHFFIVIKYLFLMVIYFRQEVVYGL